MTPKELRAYPQVAGISIGKCIYSKKKLTGKIEKKEIKDIARANVCAHAHVRSEGGGYDGWICARSKADVYKTKNKVTNTMIHELGHILSQKITHCQSWRDKVLELGGYLEKEFAKKV